MTLIKWPGGKSKEFKHIEHIIPEFNRYIEPFFGGGAIYFALRPTTAVINDISTNLTDFYGLIKNNNVKFREFLYLYNDSWNGFMNFIEGQYESIENLYYRYRNSEIDDKRMMEEVEEFIQSRYIPITHAVAIEIISDYQNLIRQMNRMVKDKIKRTKSNEIKNGDLSREDLKDNIITGFMSGLYMCFRDIYNDIGLERNNFERIPFEARIANFYFIREYCYGSMFRYNSKGEFNIPYGGISYNRKNFRDKIDKLFERQTIDRFLNTDIYNMDFERLFNSLDITEEDFIFLDPPYDTEFSDYEGRSFCENDQIRLAQLLYNMRGKFILIIKNTDFIYGLYEGQEGIRMLGFDKQYTYNVRSRNDRQVEHLIITNIPEEN